MPTKTYQKKQNGHHKNNVNYKTNYQLKEKAQNQVEITKIESAHNTSIPSTPISQEIIPSQQLVSFINPAETPCNKMENTINQHIR